MKGKTTYYKIINWTRIRVKTKQDSRNYFESLVFYSKTMKYVTRGWDKSHSLLIVFGLSNKTQWLSGLYYADSISFYSPTQLCGGGTTKSNSNELPISVPLSF